MIYNKASYLKTTNAMKKMTMTLLSLMISV